MGKMVVINGGDCILSLRNWWNKIVCQAQSLPRSGLSDEIFVGVWDLRGSYSTKSSFMFCLKVELQDQISERQVTSKDTDFSYGKCMLMVF